MMKIVTPCVRYSPMNWPTWNLDPLFTGPCPTTHMTLVFLRGILDEQGVAVQAWPLFRLGTC
jgi:hypothetical protein